MWANQQLQSSQQSAARGWLLPTRLHRLTPPPPTVMRKHSKPGPNLVPDMHAKRLPCSICFLVHRIGTCSTLCCVAVRARAKKSTSDAHTLAKREPLCKSQGHKDKGHLEETKKYIQRAHTDNKYQLQTQTQTPMAGCSPNGGADPPRCV